MELPSKKNILRFTAATLVAVGGLSQGWLMYMQNNRINTLELQRIRQEQRLKAIEDNSEVIMQEERDSADLLCHVISAVGGAVFGQPPLDCTPAKNGVSGQLPEPEPTPLPVPKISS